MTLGPGGLITFDYAAKGGKRHIQSLVDRDVYRVVETLKRRRSGRELLAFRNGRTWFDVRSDDINAYIKEVTHDGYSAKDFRTWNATVIAAVGLAVSGKAYASPTARKRAIARAVGEVAHYLGNTPAERPTSTRGSSIASTTESRSPERSTGSARASTSASPPSRARSRRRSST